MTYQTVRTTDEKDVTDVKLILETQMNSGLPMVPEETWEIEHMTGVMPRVRQQLRALHDQGAFPRAVGGRCAEVYQNRLERGELVSTLVSDGTQSWRFKLVLPVYNDAPRMTLVWDIEGAARGSRLRMYADTAGLETTVTSERRQDGQWTMTVYPLTVTGPLPELVRWVGQHSTHETETIGLLATLRLAY